MPEQFTTTVTTAQLKKGDVTADGTVVNVDSKVKYATVYIDKLMRPVRTTVDAEWTVTRERPTAEEQETAKRAFMLRRLDMAERGVVEDLRAAQEKVIKELQADAQIGHWRLSDLLEAQARHAVWARVTHVARIQADRAVSFDESTGTWTVSETYTDQHDGEQPVLDRLAVHAYVVDKVREELLQWTTFTSRSTAVLSNAIEDYEREAKAKFVSHLYGLY